MMCSKGDSSSVSPSGSCRAIEVPQTVDCLQPVVNIIPLQVFFKFILHSAISFLLFVTYKFFMCLEIQLPILDLRQYL